MSHPLGVEPDEIAVPTGHDQFIVFQSFEGNPAGTEYVRFINCVGDELLYYDVQEWCESREQAVEVMGCIMAAIFNGAVKLEAAGVPEQLKPMLPRQPLMMAASIVELAGVITQGLDQVALNVLIEYSQQLRQMMAGVERMMERYGYELCRRPVTGALHYRLKRQP